ncbi:MAG: ATP-binding protein [Planctomycetota bacterium]
MYHHRTLEQHLAEASAQFPIVLLTGPRQSGKTTLLGHQAGQDRAYVTLDDLTARALAREDPKLFLDENPPPLLIDEIQYAPDLLPYLKIRVDRDRLAGAYWLTGSQQFQMMKGVTESLAGRVAIASLHGFSRREQEGEGVDSPPFLPTRARIESRGKVGSSGAPGVYEHIWRGAFPPLVADGRDRETFLSSYLQTYVERDVRDLTQVGDLAAFTRFVRACAARTAQLLNLSTLARDVDISVPTAKSWLSVLEASYQVYLLQPYHSSLHKRLIKTPKLYFWDTGLCAHLTGWTSSEVLSSGAMAGAIFETWVVGEVLKSWHHQGLRPPVYFFRDREGREIDLLFDLDGHLYPLEIKKSATPRREWTKAWSAIESLGKPCGEGGILCLTDEIQALRPGVRALPVTTL